MRKKGCYSSSFYSHGSIDRENFSEDFRDIQRLHQMRCFVNLVVTYVCEFHGNARHRRLSHRSTEADDGYPLPLLDSVMDVLQSPASRARRGPAHQTKPTTREARQESCDRISPNIIYTSHLSASICSHSRFVDLPWRSSCQDKFKDSPEILPLIHSWYDAQAFGRVMAGTREPAIFGEGGMANPFD